MRTTCNRPPSQRCRCTSAARPDVGTGPRRSAAPAKTGRTPASRRSIEYSRSSAPEKAFHGNLCEQRPTEEHPIADESARQAERGPTTEADSMEQQHRGGAQLGAGRMLLGQDEVFGLNGVGAPFERPHQSDQEIGLGD